MSFSLTTPQMLARTKRVTRRLGWATLKPGTLLQAVEKSQGLRKGEKVNKLGVIRVVSVRREPLSRILYEEGGAASEGFPDWSEKNFLHQFASHSRIGIHEVVTRIEFEHVESAASIEDARATDRVCKRVGALATSYRRKVLGDR